MQLKLNLKYVDKYVSQKEILEEISLNRQVFADSYVGKIGPDDRKGWFKVDNYANPEMLNEILETSEYVRKNAEVFVVIGIGGSNRSALAAVECFKYNHPDAPEIIWAGNNLSGASLKRVFDRIGNRSVIIDVIAKDFNTVEPGLAFRMFREHLKERYGSDYNKHVIVTGSEGKGQLREMAERYDYKFLPFPEDVGGRYCVLTPVGLLPMAVAGIDIKQIVEAAKATENYLKSLPIEENPAVHYAVARNLLFRKGFQIEGFVVIEPELEHLARWWLQEFGETEGKIQDAVFPTYFVYSEDLHSMGQYIQEGRRFVFETYFNCFKPTELTIPLSEEEDGFNYLDKRPYDDVNHAVYQAALNAHYEDGVPCIEFLAPAPDETVFGEFYYFFLFAVYCSANLIGVNPFNQDGVENYKLNMYRILGK
ncbi:MAG TPA: glucose-6-phosphate isomerase [Acholeplasmataceae bacterium]|nr:glucose-6-phosphate isomerase [Acholeplasmataceae bacterium]